MNKVGAGLRALANEELFKLVEHYQQAPAHGQAAFNESVQTGCLWPRSQSIAQCIQNRFLNCLQRIGEGPCIDHGIALFLQAGQNSCLDQ